jgi:serine/threonine-protein phosphatase 6 regulatory ankyrin repeat subunit B
MSRESSPQEKAQKELFALAQSKPEEIKGESPEILENITIEEKIRALIVRGADVNAKGGGGLTALMMASFQGHVDVVNRLIAAGVDVRAKGNDGQTALMLASQRDHVAVVNRLIAARATVHAKKNGVTALLMASENGHVAVVDRLIAARASVHAQKYSVTALILASKGGHVAVVDRLIARGADVNAEDKPGKTALRLASERGHVAVVDHLIAAKADVNAQDRSGETALRLASKNGHVDVVDSLIAAEADVNAKHRYGETALILAIKNGHIDVVDSLIAAKADVNAKQNGVTALLMASENGHVDVVDRLMAAGADVSAKGSDGQTALMLAIEKGHVDVVDRLMAAGADVNAKRENRVPDYRTRDCDRARLERKNGETALILAIENGHIAVADRLMAAGGDVNAKRGYGVTALMVAIEKGYVAVVDRLIARGADVNAQDRSGETALRLASKNGHVDVVDSLIAAGADVNAKHRYGETALMLASRRGRINVIRKMLEMGVVDQQEMASIPQLQIPDLQQIIDLQIEVGNKIKSICDNISEGKPYNEVVRLRRVFARLEDNEIGTYETLAEIPREAKQMEEKKQGQQNTDKASNLDMLFGVGGFYGQVLNSIKQYACSDSAVDTQKEKNIMALIEALNPHGKHRPMFGLDMQGHANSVINNLVKSSQANVEIANYENEGQKPLKLLSEDSKPKAKDENRQFTKGEKGTAKLLGRILSQDGLGAIVNSYLPQEEINALLEKPGRKGAYGKGLVQTLAGKIKQVTQDAKKVMDITGIPVEKQTLCANGKIITSVSLLLSGLQRQQVDIKEAVAEEKVSNPHQQAVLARRGAAVDSKEESPNR